MSIPRSLVEAVRAHRVVPFVGAGVSVGVKRDLFPAWTRLLQNIADHMQDEGIDAAEVERVRGLVQAGDLVLAAEGALRALGPYVFHGFLRRNYRQPRPTDANLEVVRAIWALRPPLVITTNYDNVLRWGGPAEVQLVANDQHEELSLLGEASSEWPWVWHLHGTIERMATVILAGRDYKRLYEQDERDRVASYERALFELQKTLASKSLLYIGFGLTDPYVLEQIAHVLDLTRGSVAPSYALMKQGQGNKADLWENYNVRLIEYAEHDMLPGLIGDIARQAFGAPAAQVAIAAPVAVPRDLSFDVNVGPVGGTAMGSPATGGEDATRTPIIERSQLVDAFGRELVRSRRLLLLAPHGGGARHLASQIARKRFGKSVTWLEPPRVPECSEAQYCSFVARNDKVHDFSALVRWLEGRALAAGKDHLVALRHDDGPLHHLDRLGEILRTLIDDPRARNVHVLVAGEDEVARLRSGARETSLFSDAPTRHVPAFTVDEVVQLLHEAGLDARWARDVWQATGGLPALVALAIAGKEALDAAAVTARLARSTAVRGRLGRRLLDDDRAGIPAERHARTVLAAMLAGQDVQPLQTIEDDLDHAEVRLFYDGLVIAGAGGATVFRCEAVRRAATDLLAARV